MTDITTYVGNSLSIPVEITEEIEVAGELTETAKDITSYTAFFMAKKHIRDTDANAIIAKEWSSHSDPTAGETEIDLDAADLDTEGNFIYEFGIESPTGEVTTIVTGRLIVSAVVQQSHA